VTARYRYDVRLPVGMRIPCSLDSLKNSPELPPSIYSSGEEVFGSGARDELLGEAMRFAAQAPISLSRLMLPRLQYGLSMTRYNKVEGFSTGLLAEQQLGGGYLASLTTRLGVADLEPNVELSAARTNLVRTLRLTGYNRLVSAGDWGSPLSFGSSLSALLFGRDQGFYYRATGADLQWTTSRGTRLQWRAFAEGQRNAAQKTTYSFGPALPPNIVSERAFFSGVGVRYLAQKGENPRGTRMFTDARMEGAMGDSLYGRGAVDMTVSRGFGSRAAAALTLAAGTSVGHLPPQRLWYLGGTHTVRGQEPDTAQRGNAFWLARAELARGAPIVRMAIFGDLGWVGDRSRVSDVGRPMSGVGLGWSFFDGVIRLDIARGLYPRLQNRVDLYMEARF
jgi:hypothetical protein